MLLAGLLLSVGLPGGWAAAESTDEPEDTQSTIQYQAGLSYHDYLERYKDAENGSESLRVTAQQLVRYSGDVTVRENLFGREGLSVETGESSTAEFRFSVAASGLYTLTVAYYPLEGKSSSIVRSFRLDGELPYEEVREVDFPRRWKDAGEITQDRNGNDIRPSQEEAPAWMTKSLTDGMGYYTEPLQFYLAAGEHTLSIEAVKEPMAIGELLFAPAESTPSYAQVQQSYAQQGLTDTTGYFRKLQGEAAAYKSDFSIYPIYDRSSVDTEPNSASQIRLNTIGGSKWSVPGQWIEWTVEDVPADGLYILGIKGRQNLLNGAYSARKLSINGTVPFAEAEELRFSYDTGWSMTVLADGEGNPYRFPLQKGTNTIRLEVTLGELSSLLMEVSECVTNLNDVYMKVLMITGPNPDTLRDYQFRKQIPDALALLEEQGVKLHELYDRYVALTGQNGQQAQTLKKLYRMAEELVERPDRLATRFSTFSSNVTELGTWLSTVSDQPLEIDYLVVASPDQTIEPVKGAFFRNFWFGVRQLVASFTQDYDTMADTQDETQETITVWVGNGATGGRDQAQVLQRMASNSFSTEQNISVNIQLVAMGALLPATMSGRGPDVALTLNASDPLNYAIRHGVLDLSGMPGFDEVKTRFMPSALEPFSFDGEVYALPETQTFYMMFYREDILSELELSIPETWQDVIDMLPVLQKKNLTFGMPIPAADGAVGVGFPAYAMLLFQNGGSLYNDSGSHTRLGEKQGVDAFYTWTKLYTDYKLLTQYDFMNMFRSGSVPIGIIDYATYNTLQVFAPQIKGRWNFCTVPGTPQADGTVDHSSCGTTTGCVIMSRTKHESAAWEFLKWWTSSEVQGEFGLELESVQGAAGRYSPANVEALYQIPWSKEEYDAITEQWEQVKGLREVPGSYVTSRFVDFAFRNAVYKSVSPDESIIDAAKQIDEELRIRRKEFGLPVE